MSWGKIELRYRDSKNVFFDGEASPAPGGGSMPGGLRILDLGLFDITTLDNGPQTIYTPANGDFVALTFSLDGYVGQDIDAGNGDAVIGQNPVFGGVDNYLLFLPTAGSETVTDDLMGGASVAGTAFPKSVAPCFMPTADPIEAQAFTGNGYPIPVAKPAWQAGHGYLEGDFVTVTGGVLVASNAGTSDVTEPAYPGAGSTVLDNDITWIAPTPTTVGAIHLYAMVATPVAP